MYRLWDTLHDAFCIGTAFNLHATTPWGLMLGIAYEAQKAGFVYVRGTERHLGTLNPLSTLLQPLRP